VTNPAALDPSPGNETNPGGDDVDHHVTAGWLAVNRVPATATRMLASIDPLAPSRFRVNGPFANTPGFAASVPDPRRAAAVAPGRTARQGLRKLTRFLGLQAAPGRTTAVPDSDAG
jgi:hypothetical protein